MGAAGIDSALGTGSSMGSGTGEGAAMSGSNARKPMAATRTGDARAADYLNV